MNRTLLATTALFAALALPAIAEAASGFATANVNMRSGPSTAYPAVTMIPVGQPLRINGCLSETPWCDVSFAGGRGWVAGRYVQAVYQQRRVYVGPEYYRPLGIPTITFDLDNYWDRNYRGRDFYRDRDRWAQGPDWDRNDPNSYRRPPPRGPVYDNQDDGDQGNPPRRGNWPRQPGYNNGDDDSFQGDDNAPRRPRYRRPYNDNGQQLDDNAPRQGDFSGDNNAPRMPPRQQGQDRQQDQGQPRRQPQGQMQPAPQGQPPRRQPQDQGQAQPPRQQPQDQQQQPRPPQPAPQQAQPQPQPAPPPRQPSNDAAPRPSNNQPAGGHGNLNAPGQNGDDRNCGNAPACGPQPHFSHN